MTTRRALLAAGAAALAAPGFAQDTWHVTAWKDLIFGTGDVFTAAAERIAADGGADLAPGVILALRYARGNSDTLNALMVRLTGGTGQGWFDWMLWQEANPDIVPRQGYAEFKRDILLRIDPKFAGFLDPGHLGRDAARIRFEEVTWGGVRKDGIPSLDAPPMIPADEAAYLQPDDLVFGIDIGGDIRAYPLRIMGWHEMFNDVIGGVPVALAYCTLCGAGILFETAVAGRRDPLVFGSSGFLYRSNKLMFDRETNSLWNQFTGEPVIGPLAQSDIVLRQRPVVIEPWPVWSARHPGTAVLSLDTGYVRDYGSGVVYRDYFGSPDLMFPAVSDESELEQKAHVFGIRTFAAAKAWPLDAFAEAPVINDSVGQLNVVLIGDAAGRSARAYDRGETTVPANLAGWTVTEAALERADGQSLPRVAGHVAYWFAWNGYLGAESELYGR